MGDSATIHSNYPGKFRYGYIFVPLLFLIQVILVLFASLEMYNVLVVGLVLLSSILILVKPIFGIYMLLFLTLGFEGKLVTELILFRVGFNWYLYDLWTLVFFLGLSPRFLSGEYKIKINNLFLSVLIFFAACFVSIIWGMKSGYPLQSIFYDLRGFYYYIIFIPVSLIITKEDLKRLFLFIITVGTIKCFVDIFLSLYVFEKSFDATTREYLTFARLTGFAEVVYPIIFSASVVFFLLSKSVANRLLIIPSVVISGIALFLSYTRGSWLATFLYFAIIILYLAYTKRINLKLQNIGLSTVGIIILLIAIQLTNVFEFDIFIKRLTSVTASKIDVSNLGRLVEYATALESFFRNPILGAGFGLTYDYFAPGIGYLSTTYVHNSYLYVISKMGLVGFIPFLFILYFVLKATFQIGNKDIVETDYKYPFIITSLLLLISIKALTTWHLNTWSFSLFIGFVMGVASWYLNQANETNER